MNIEVASPPVANVFAGNENVGYVSNLRGKWVFTQAWDAGENVPKRFTTNTPEEMKLQLSGFGLRVVNISTATKLKWEKNNNKRWKIEKDREEEYNKKPPRPPRPLGKFPGNTPEGQRHQTTTTRNKKMKNKVSLAPVKFISTANIIQSTILRSFAGASFESYVVTAKDEAVDWRSVKKIAVQTRAAIVDFMNTLELNDKADRNSYPSPDKNLACWCAISSTVLHDKLRKEGINSKVVVGVFDPEQNKSWKNYDINHSWLQIGDKVVDITASQFKGQQPIVISSAKNPLYHPVQQISNQKQALNTFKEWPKEQKPSTDKSKALQKHYIGKVFKDDPAAQFKTFTHLNKWWDKLNLQEQKKYVHDHPHTHLKVKAKANVNLAELDKMLVIDTAAYIWWNAMSVAEQTVYLHENPDSRFKVFAKTSSGIREHLEKNGWERNGKVWKHPVSKNKLVRRENSTHQYHAVVTHPTGEVTHHKTNSPELMRRTISKLSKKPDNSGIADTLSQKKGSLHEHLGIEHGQPLPLTALQKLADSDHPLAGRARLVLNLKRAKKNGPISYRAHSALDFTAPETGMHIYNLSEHHKSRAGFHKKTAATHPDPAKAQLHNEAAAHHSKAGKSFELARKSYNTLKPSNAINTGMHYRTGAAHANKAARVEKLIDPSYEEKAFGESPHAPWTHKNLADHHDNKAVEHQANKPLANLHRQAANHHRNAAEALKTHQFGARTTSQNAHNFAAKNKITPHEED